MDGREGLVPTEKPRLDSRVVEFPHAASDTPRLWAAEGRCSARSAGALNQGDGYLLTALNCGINRKCRPEIGLPICLLRIDLA